MSPSLTQFVHALSLFFTFYVIISEHAIVIIYHRFLDFRDVSVEAFPGETDILENFKLMFSFACTHVRQ